MRSRDPTRLSISLLVSQEEWQRYNKDLDAFYEEYRKHFEFLNMIGDAKTRSIKFDLWLHNSGNGLANDIDVFVLFPTNLIFVGEEGSEDSKPLKEDIESPKPPDKPKSILAGIGDLPSLHPLAPEILAIPKETYSRLDPWTPDISVKKGSDDEYEIHTRVGKLKHGHPVCLGNFIAVFASWSDVKAFHATYTISTSELPDKTEGRIHFVVNLQTNGNDE